jgi:hypothetical protein
MLNLKKLAGPALEYYASYSSLLHLSLSQLVDIIPLLLSAELGIALN